MSNRVTLTRDLAFASGQDAGNASMRKHNRKAWNDEDYNVAARTTNKLLRYVPLSAGGLMGIPEKMLADMI